MILGRFWCKKVACKIIENFSQVGKRLGKIFWKFEVEWVKLFGVWNECFLQKVAMRKNEIDSYLQKLEDQLINQVPKISIELSRSWSNNFPKAAAVYIFREGEEICYVGETGSIQGRMSDVLNTKNHTLRRNIGHSHFSEVPGFTKANSKKGFTEDIETMLNNKITNDLTISFVLVELGRKELEERLYEKYSPKYAIKGKRGTTKAYTKKEKQEKNAQAYEPWTSEMDDQLEVLFCEGNKIKDLCTLLGRSSGAIRSRIKKLELKEKYGI